MATLARPFLFAWHFLTAIPLSRLHHEPTAAELATSMAWFPVIGLLLGGSLVLADLTMSNVFSPHVVNAFLIVLLILLTRGLHQDGLADTLDGLAGGATPSERLPIMRDPRIGAIGATGLFLSLLLRYAGLMALPSELRIPTLLCMPTVGRSVMVALAWCSPSARSDDGLAAPFVSQLSWPHLLTAMSITATALVLGFGSRAGATMLVVATGTVLALRRACRTAFGGVTGDTLGAANELAELLVLLLVPLLHGLA